jgi:hypothetical protein
MNRQEEVEEEEEEEEREEAPFPTEKVQPFIQRYLGVPMSFEASPRHRRRARQMSPRRLHEEDETGSEHGSDHNQQQEQQQQPQQQQQQQPQPQQPQPQPQHQQHQHGFATTYVRSELEHLRMPMMGQAVGVIFTLCLLGGGMIYWWKDHHRVSSGFLHVNGRHTHLPKKAAPSSAIGGNLEQLMDVFGGFATTAQVEEQGKELTAMVDARLEQHTTAMSDAVSQVVQGVEEIKSQVQDLAKHEKPKQRPKQLAEEEANQKALVAQVVDGVSLALGNSLREDIQEGLDRGVTSSTSTYSHWLAKERELDQRYALAFESLMNKTDHRFNEMAAQQAKERRVRQELEDARAGHTLEIARMTAEHQDAVRTLNGSWSGKAAEWAKEKEALLASHAEEVQRLKAEAAVRFENLRKAWAEQVQQREVLWREFMEKRGFNFQDLPIYPFREDPLLDFAKKDVDAAKEAKRDAKAKEMVDALVGEPLHKILEDEKNKLLTEMTEKVEVPGQYWYKKGTGEKWKKAIGEVLNQSFPVIQDKSEEYMRDPFKEGDRGWVSKKDLGGEKQDKIRRAGNM